MRKTTLLFAIGWAVAFSFAAQAQENARPGKTDVAITHVLPSSDISGLNVINKKGEKLGTINDLVVDLKSGDVKYAALSHGGALGVGSKMFAVPWQAMTFVFGQPNNQNERHFVLDTTKEHLDNAPGFDSSNWPNVADPKWGESIDKHFNVNRDHPVTTSGTKDAQIAYETVFRCSKLKGMDVRNDANEDLGSVSDVAIDMGHGKIKYMALSYGSWFTGGNKLFAVPLSSFTLNHANNKTFFVVHVNKDALKNAPGFAKDRWPNAADQNWMHEVDTYYEWTAQRNTTTGGTAPNR